MWHRGLLFILESISVSDSLLLWYTKGFANRKQKLVLSGEAGTPQGSILGPLVFLIYINYIVDDINSCIRLFADETSLYIIVDNLQQAANSFYADFAINPFFPTKSEFMVPLHPPLNMNQQNINEITLHKHLGLIFSNDCSLQEHIDFIKVKSCSRHNTLAGVSA